MRTRVKICGITRPEDGIKAAQYGADAIGLVFYPQSPRCVDLEQARQICAALPPFVAVVGLFVNASQQQIRSVLDRLPVDLIQFHGDEPPGDCGAYGRRYVKAIKVGAGCDITGMMARYPDAAGFLLDADHPDLPGGTGQVFQWDQIPGELPKPIILAGGLNPHNVAAAVRQVRPYAVDVSSGVEATQGVKDPARMAAFIQGVRSVDPE